MSNMDRMTDRSRKVMAIAEQQAQRLKKVAVEPEHVLLSLALEGAGVAACVLRQLSVGPEQIETAMGAQADSPLPSHTTAQLPLATSTCDLINRALEEAILLNHNYIGTEHLMLAITTASEESVCEILAKLGLSSEELRYEVYSLLGHALS